MCSWAILGGRRVSARAVPDQPSEIPTVIRTKDADSQLGNGARQREFMPSVRCTRWFMRRGTQMGFVPALCGVRIRLTGPRFPWMRRTREKRRLQSVDGPSGQPKESRPHQFRRTMLRAQQGPRRRQSLVLAYVETLSVSYSQAPDPAPDRLTASNDPLVSTDSRRRGICRIVLCLLVPQWLPLDVS